MTGGYQSKKLKEDKRNKKIAIALWLLIFLALLANLVIFLAASKYSRINQFTVTGLKNTENPKEFIQLMEAQVQNGFIAKILGTDNYFAWSLNTDFKNPQFGDIEMKKNIKTGTVSFFVKLKERYAIWCKTTDESSVENCRWIDENGIAFESAPSSRGQLIPSIWEEVELAEFSANAQIMPVQKFQYVKDILNAFKELEIQRKQVVLERELQELQIFTTSGTKIIFSLRFDPNETALPAIQEFQEKPGLEFFSEINLAVEGRAFTTVK